MAPPSDVPEVQRPTVQRPAPGEPTAPAAAPPPATSQPSPAAASAGGPPVLPPNSSGGTPAPAQPQPAAPTASAPAPAQPSAPAPDPGATTAPVVNWEDPAAAPVMSGTAAPDPSAVQWDTPAGAAPAPGAAAAMAPPPRPWGRGIGLYVSGGISFGVGMGFRIASSVDGYGTLDSFIYSFAYNPLFATGLGLWGGARAMAAHQHAWDDTFGNAGKKKRFVMPGLGWGLFGAGMAIWLGTRFAIFGPSLGTQQAYRIWEAGYYLSLPLTFSGMHIGAYGSAYNSHLSRYRFYQNVSLAPMRIRGPRDASGRASEVWGLSLSGRF